MAVNLKTLDFSLLSEFSVGTTAPLELLLVKLKHEVFGKPLDVPLYCLNERASTSYRSARSVLSTIRPPRPSEILDRLNIPAYICFCW